MENRCSLATDQLFKVVRVLGDVFCPFFGQIFFGEDGLDRALIDAQTAVNASVGINIKHVTGFKVVVILGGMNAVHRADFDAGSVLGVHTGLSNDVRHDITFVSEIKREKQSILGTQYRENWLWGKWKSGL